MRIYGLDFTSNPSKAASRSARAKRLTLATCSLDETTLVVEKLDELNTSKEGDFSLFDDWLNSRDRWEGEKTWVGGIDFPFGMPVEAVERFEWLKDGDEPTWTNYISSLFARTADVDQFRDLLESWRKESSSGKSKRVFLLRRTDKLSSFAGSSPSSPMKVHHQCNPPVGRMFFQGADRLRRSDVSIVPTRVNNSGKVVIEAYPRLVADKFVPGGKYKEGDDLSACREAIINGLGAANPYGLTVRFDNADDRRSCIVDELGDKLDSVLSAVQAGWSYLSEQQEARKSSSRKHRYGVPQFGVSALRQIVELEGWIVDPLLLNSISPSLKQKAHKAMNHPPTLRKPKEGRTVAVVGDVYRFLATGEETDGKYAMWEALVPPGGGPPPHIHSREEESFYILEGEITFTVGEEKIVATEGMFANMPVGSLHSFRNNTDKPARMILSVAPAGLEKMFFEFGVPLEEGSTEALPPTKEEIDKLLEIAPNYGIEIKVPER